MSTHPVFSPETTNPSERVTVVREREALTAQRNGDQPETEIRGTRDHLLRESVIQCVYFFLKKIGVHALIIHWINLNE